MLERYTGKGKNETELYEAAKSWGVDPKAEMYKLPAIYVGAYAEKDAEITLALWQELKKEIRSSRYKFNHGYGNGIVSLFELI